AVGTINEQQAAEVNVQLAAARAQTVEKKAKYEQAQRIHDGGAALETITAVLDSSSIAALRLQEAASARQEADLLTRYGSEHPAIVKVRAERADARRQMAREVNRIVQIMKVDYEFALKKEESLDTNLKELTGAYTRSDAVLTRL